MIGAVQGRGTSVAFCVTVALVAASSVGGADWPAYRHDATRRAFTAEQIATTLSLQWTHAGAGVPSPAWPDPVRENHMMSFDHAFHVVAAGGTVYFGSSADHQVHALDLATGRRRWRFFTDGPVRFAPAVWRGKLYVAGDDGRVYCLSAADGKLIWRFSPDSDERIMGNEQMISRWPLRSGLLVADGLVYFTAGMWPAEGVWAYALQAEDGKVVWKVRQPPKLAPQGYLAADEKHLLVPAGRAKLWVIDRASGQARSGQGHSWAMVAGERLFSGPPPFKGNENLPIAGSPPLPPRDRPVIVWQATGKGKPRRIAETGCAAADDETCYVAGKGKIVARGLANLAPKWEAACGPVFSLAVAGKTLIVGGRNTVALLSAETGKELWSAGVAGQARGLAVSDGRLLVSTHTGRIHCFGPTAPPARVAPAKSPVPAAGNEHMTTRAEQILEDTKVTSGFCLLAGAEDGRLAMALARRSKLRIYCAEGDAGKVAAARKLLAEAGLYGTRVVVHHVSPLKLPYPDYFADLVLVPRANIFSPGELFRVLRPCGGVGWPRSRDLWRRILTREPPSGGIGRVVRGKLPGAGEWTHQYADAGKSGSSGDTLVKWPMRLLWFGKPGPGRMMQRHWRGTAPVFANGRMFILGQHCIIAVDAYNGRELWSREMPSIQRRVVDIRGGSMVADADSVYISTSNMCLRFDAATGKLLHTYRIPVRRPRLAIGAGRTFALGDKGKITVAAEANALVLTLTTKDVRVINAEPMNNPDRGDSWELFFDFRPAGRRTGMYGKGAFHAIVVPATDQAAGGTWQAGLWSPTCPPLRLTGTLTGDGSATTVRILWNDIAKLVGRKPADFTFGAILNSSFDGKALTGRTYLFASAASYRLTNCQATLLLDAPGNKQAPPGPSLPASEPGESMAWGQLFVQGDIILGTVAEQSDSPQALLHGWDFSSERNDYTGPPVAKVLGIIGVKPDVRYVFALNKTTGRVLWVRPAGEAISHNAIALGPRCVYLIDRPARPKATDLKRRGKQAPAPAADDGAVLEALDLATARRLWRVDDGLADYRQLRLGGGVLLAASRSGMTAYSADDGRKLWTVARKQPMHHCSAFVRAPVITRKWVYDEPHAYDVQTGKARTLGPPAAPAKPGAAPTPNLWKWNAGRGCGTVSAAENMLFYRAKGPILFDATGTTGGHEFVGIRPGCYINMIAAGGLVLMPEASSGCGCPYNFQTTVVMMPR